MSAYFLFGCKISNFLRLTDYRALKIKVDIPPTPPSCTMPARTTSPSVFSHRPPLSHPEILVLSSATFVPSPAKHPLFPPICAPTPLITAPRPSRCATSRHRKPGPQPLMVPYTYLPTHTVTIAIATNTLLGGIQPTRWQSDITEGPRAVSIYCRGKKGPPGRALHAGTRQSPTAVKRKFPIPTAGTAKRMVLKRMCAAKSLILSDGAKAGRPQPRFYHHNALTCHYHLLTCHLDIMTT